MFGSMVFMWFLVVFKLDVGRSGVCVFLKVFGGMVIVIFGFLVKRGFWL